MNKIYLLQKWKKNVVDMQHISHCKKKSTCNTIYPVFFLDLETQFAEMGSMCNIFLVATVIICNLKSF